MTNKLSIASKELAEAVSAYESADVKYREANREHTSATNRLNEKQKKFDEVVNEMRKSAPSGSDWKSHRGAAA